MPARVAALGAGGAPLPPSRPPPPALGLTRPRLPFASPAAPPPPPSSSLAPLRGRLTRASQVPGLSPAGSAGSTSARLLCICTNIREGGRLELLHLKAPNKALQGVSGRWQRYVGVAWGDRRSPGKPQTIGRGDPLTVRARWPLNELRSVWWESGRAEFWLAFRAPGGEEAGGVRVGEGGEVHGFSIADSRGGERFVQQLLDICPGSARAMPPSGVCARSERLSPASPGGGGPGHLSGGGGGGAGGSERQPLPPSPRSPGGGGAALERVLASTRRALRRLDAGARPEEWAALSEQCIGGKELLGSILRREMLSGAGNLSAGELSEAQTLHNRLVLVLSLEEEVGPQAPFSLPETDCRPSAPWAEPLDAPSRGPAEEAEASAPELEPAMAHLFAQGLGERKGERAVPKSLEPEFSGALGASGGGESAGQPPGVEAPGPGCGLSLELPPSAPAVGGEGETDEDDGFCIICFERRVDCAILECGHACICMACSSGLRGECPVCRGTISRVVKLYYS